MRLLLTSLYLPNEVISGLLLAFRICEMLRPIPKYQEQMWMYPPTVRLFLHCPIHLELWIMWARIGQQMILYNIILQARQSAHELPD
jgi:hypothetical protein